jgi:hypothetical protein
VKLTKEQFLEVEEGEGILAIDEYTNEKWRQEAKKVATVGYNLPYLHTAARISKDPCKLIRYGGWKRR